MIQKLRGLTLVEAMVATLVLSVTVVAVAQAIMAGQMQTYEALHRRRGMELAEAMMEEIVRLPYDDPDGSSSPGPEVGESARTKYDNIDDYHAYAETAGSLTDSEGIAYTTPFQSFARSVTVVNGNTTVSGFGSAFAGQTVTVTVNDGKGTAWTISTFVPQPPS